MSNSRIPGDNYCKLALPHTATLKKQHLLPKTEMSQRTEALAAAVWFLCFLTSCTVQTHIRMTDTTAAAEQLVFAN